MLAFFVSVALSAVGQPADDDSVIFYNGKCEPLVQTGNVHWGVSPDERRDMVALDKRLNAAYRGRMASLTKVTKAALRTSQRQWIAIRNATCRLDEPVSIADVSAATCFMDETNKRLSFLENGGVASANVSSLATLSGEWTIRKAILANPEGVQAYSTDQLQALVGNRLLINRDGASWRVSHGQTILREHTWTTDQCREPRVQPTAQSKFDIRCNDGSIFGPEASFSIQGSGDLKLDWWDGVVLYLRKAK